MKNAITKTSTETAVHLTTGHHMELHALPFALGGFGAVLVSLCVVGIASMFPAGGANFQPLAALSEVAMGIAGLLLIRAAMESRAGRASQPAAMNAALALSGSFILIGLTSFDAATATIARRAGILVAVVGTLLLTAIVLGRNPNPDMRMRGSIAGVGASFILLATAIAYPAGGPPTSLLWRAGFLETLGASALLIWAIAGYLTFTSPAMRSGSTPRWLGPAGVGLFGVALFATGLDGTLAMSWDSPDSSGMANWTTIVASNLAAIGSLVAGAAIASFGLLKLSHATTGITAASEVRHAGASGELPYVEATSGAAEKVDTHAGGFDSRTGGSRALNSPRTRLRNAGNILLGSGIAAGLLTVLPWVSVTVFITFTANPWFISGAGETESWWAGDSAGGPAAVGLIRALGPGLLLGAAMIAAAGWAVRQGTPKRGLALAGAAVYATFVVLGIVAAFLNADNGVTFSSWNIGLWGSILNVAVIGYAISLMTPIEEIRESATSDLSPQ